MVRRQNQHQRVRVDGGKQAGGRGNSRGGVPGDGLQNDMTGLHTDLAQLFSDEKTMFFVTNHQRWSEGGRVGYPPCGFLHQL